MGWAYPGNPVASYFRWWLLNQPPLFSVSSSSVPSNRKRPATSVPLRQGSRRRRPSSALHLPGEPRDPAPASTGDDSANTGGAPFFHRGPECERHQPNHHSSSPAQPHHRWGYAGCGSFPCSHFSAIYVDRSHSPTCGASATSTATSAPGIDAAVQGSVASALQALSGESLLGVAQPESRPPNFFNSMSVPIGARLDAKLKAKIWANEYFEFGQLLHSLPADNKYRISISDNQAGATPSLCLEPTRKAKAISTIEQWTDAFQVSLVFTHQSFLLRHLLLWSMVRWSGIWPRGRGTGNIMIPISGTCGSRTRVACRGGPPTGSSGCAPSISPRERWRPHHPGLPLPRLSSWGIAASSIWVLLALAALISMSVPSVALHIQPVSAFFVPQSPKALHALLPTRLPDRLGLGPELPTPIRVDRFLPLLSNYAPEAALYLANGFTRGFPLHFDGPRTSSFASNLLSARQHPLVVTAKLSQELAAQRIAGPFTTPPFSPFRISPLGVVPRKTPGSYRLIHHLSYPRGASVNDGIAPEHLGVSYARIDDAVRLIKQCGRGCFLAKNDIESAFRIIPIHPGDYCLLGMCWEGQFYYDRCMPMGCSSSCKTFETFSTALEWIAKHVLGVPHMIHLLVDFLLVSSTLAGCQARLARFLALCTYLGVPIAPAKTVGPFRVLSFAGIELNSVHMEARLPQDKSDKCLSFLSEFAWRRKVTLRELQSLIGLLNFACSVVGPGRAFLRRLIDLTKGAKKPHQFIRLTKAARADLVTWSNFLHQFNGRSLFLHDHWVDSSTLRLFTDASGALGYGAIFGTEWCYGEWPGSWKGLNIAILEFFPILLSVLLWGSKMRNRRIVFFTDNEALVHVINKASCRDTVLMGFVRRLVLACLNFNILFRARHVPGVHNELADSLSRLQVHRFRQLALVDMHPFPTLVFLHLQPLNWQL